jgi:hypothetical protein
MARKVSSDSKRRQNELDAASIVMQIFNVVSEQADRRSWLTLPSQAQIARQYVPAGSYTVSVNTQDSAKIDVQAGKTTLIWVIETAVRSRFYSVIL